jgi:hypothetical protein
LATAVLHKPQSINISPNFVVERSEILLRIVEASGSILTPEAGYLEILHDFSQSRQKNILVVH